MTTTTKDDAIVNTPKDTALATLPEYLRDAQGQGGEELGANDVRPPRLALAQSGNPQMKRNSPKFIEGLSEGDIFNDLTQQNHKSGPVEAIFLKFLGLRAIQFGDPKKGEPTIVDFDVPTALDKDGQFSDHRLRFRDNPENPKKRLKPTATLFYEYLVFLPQTQEVVSVSMKNTQVKVAININSLLKQPLVVGGVLVPKPPFYARTIELGSALQSDDTYTWANWTYRLKGATSPEVGAAAAAIYRSFEGKRVVTGVEAEGAAAEKASIDSDENIPF